MRAAWLREMMARVFASGPERPPLTGYAYSDLGYILWGFAAEDTLGAPLYQQIDLYGASKRLTWKARSDELIKAYDMSLK